MGVHDVVSARRGFSNGATKVQRLSVYQMANGDELSEKGQKQMVRPEQKSVMLMKDIVHKIFQACSTDVRPTWEIFSTVETFPLLDKYKKVVGCDKDSSCLQTSMPCFWRFMLFRT